MSQSPQWPDQWPDQPDQSPGSDSPFSRLARSRRGLTAITIVTSVLIVALLGTLALVLSSNALGAPAQSGQDGSNGQITNAGAAQTMTADGAGGHTSSSGGTPTGGGGDKHAAPTPTSGHGSATPTPTSGVITGCCLTFSPYVHQVISQATLSGTSVGPVVATCPSGEVALSGGWAVAYNSGATIFRSERTGTGSWGIYVRHSSSVGVTTYAECLANASGATIAERAAYTSDSPGYAGGAMPSCNGGEVLVGGGFAFQNDLHLYYFAGSSATQWEVRTFNDGDSSATLNVYAECLIYSKARSSQTAYSGNVSVDDGFRGGVASKACPSGAYVSGGGFAYGDGAAFIYATWASGNGTTWTADLYANGGQGEHLGSWAMCLGF
jgi:type II secretory pathway pseudopilin PulG